MYRVQLRLTGKPRLKLSLYFENGIMSIPQVFAGTNTVRVTYRWETAAGAKENVRTLQPSDFRGGEAVYTLDAPGLARCKSVAIAY